MARNLVDDRFHQRRGAQRGERLPFFAQSTVVIVRDAAYDHEGLDSVALDGSDDLIDFRVETEHVAFFAQRRFEVIVADEILAAGDHAETKRRT